jgi:alpha-galactosidase/6-phospho-beta-glucosidase family protein
VKIVFIGGGSYSWGPTLLGDLALSGSLAGQVCLMDIDQIAGERLRLLGERYMAQQRSPIEISYTPSLAAALEGADYVIVSITTGGLDAMRGDLELPEGYGIYQAVGDTVGPGGIARALRNIPVLVTIAREMERRCPNAWLLNVTNPMTTLCRAVTRATSIRTIGLCHELRGVERRANALLGHAAPIEWRVSGINHLPWLVGQNPDALANFAARMRDALTSTLQEEDPFRDNFRIKLDLLDLYGTFPAAGDRHVAEFFPSYLDSPDAARERYDVRLTTIPRREANRAASVQSVLRQLDGREPLVLKQSSEQAVPVIESLAGKRQGAFVVNVPNRGQLSGIPLDAVVECMASIDANGVHPQAAPAVNTAVLAWLHTHVAAQELTVEAALEHKADNALQALLLDPLSHRLRTDDARNLLRDLLAHNARFLPSTPSGTV